MDFLSTALVYQDNDTLLGEPSLRKVVASIFKFSLNQLTLATERFLRGQVLSFDAHVGENLCQIRACINYDYFLRIKSDYMRKKIENHLFLLRKSSIIANAVYEYELEKSSRKRSSKQRYHESQQTLTEYLKENNLLFSIPRELYTLFLMFVLSEFKYFDQDKDCFYIDYSAIKYGLLGSNSMSKRYIQYLQSELANISCDYVDVLCSDALPQLQSVLSYYQISLQDGKLALPCYLVTHILFTYLKSREMYLLFDVATSSGKKFSCLTMLRGSACVVIDHVSTNVSSNEFMPMLVFRGVTRNFSTKCQLQEYIESEGLEKLVYMNMAGHPQYVGVEDVDFENDAHIVDNTARESLLKLGRQYKKHKVLAQSEGFCRENDQLFYIKHIFCSEVCYFLSSVDADVEV